MQRQKPKGNWKKDRLKKRKFIARALKWTEATLNEIARRARATRLTVRRVNVQTISGLPIRDAERIGEAAGKAMSKALKKRMARPKINFFTAEQRPKR